MERSKVYEKAKKRTGEQALCYLTLLRWRKGCSCVIRRVGREATTLLFSAHICGRLGSLAKHRNKANNRAFIDASQR